MAAASTYLIWVRLSILRIGRDTQRALPDSILMAARGPCKFSAFRVSIRPGGLIGALGEWDQDARIFQERQEQDQNSDR